MDIPVTATSKFVDDETLLDGFPSALPDGGTARAQSGPAPTTPVVKGPDTSAPRVRVPVRVHPDTKERAAYWASRAGVSVNEYMVMAVEEKISRENGDYDLPTLEIARLGQLIDQMSSLARNVSNLQIVTQTGFDGLLGLTKGDNYLLDDEDGEIGEAGV